MTAAGKGIMDLLLWVAGLLEKKSQGESEL
jgi:hypothetical protein